MKDVDSESEKREQKMHFSGFSISHICSAWDANRQKIQYEEEFKI